MIKIITLLFFLPFFLISQSWTNSANFIGQGRHHPITFSNDNFGFVVGGSYLDDVYKYDRINDSWVQLQDFPAQGRGYSYAVTVGDKAYMGLGSTDNGLYPNDWWEYDMVNDIWTQKANFPGDGRNHPAMVVVNNKIYLGCGSNSSGNLGDWWEYNVNNDIWTQKTGIIGNERHHPFYFGIDNYAYVGFGHGSDPGPGSNPSSGYYVYNDFYRYDPSNDNWIQLNDFPSESRVAGTQFSYNGKGYILSGDGDNHGPLDSGEFWEYNPLNDTWFQLLSHPGDAIWAPGNFVIGCDLYFLLGENTNASTPTYPVALYRYKLSEDCGCTDATAFNFSNIATTDDGSCCYVSGCTDQFSFNYDSSACYDDGSCISAVLGCLNPSASNYNSFANVDVFNGGALDNTIGSGSYFNGNQHLIFNSYEDCLIKSADFYIDNTNTITFELRDNNGNVIDDTTHTLSPGKQNVTLNFDVPNALSLQLGVSSNNSGLYRNNSGPNYPYNIGDMINITGSSASQPGYYYYYYNIKVEAKCFDLSNVSNNENEYNKKKLINIVNVLGKKVKIQNKQTLFYIYEDGTVDKKVIINSY